MIRSNSQRKLLSLAVAAALGSMLALPARAQEGGDIGKRLLADASVRLALQAAAEDEPQTIADQLRLCEIPAPPFGEGPRAQAYAAAFRALGLQNVRLDGAGNVLGERPGRAVRPHLVFSAHLDTVFPAATDVRTGIGKTIEWAKANDWYLA